MSRGRVLRRRLPTRYGGCVLYVTPEGGGLRYWRNTLEKIDPVLLESAFEMVSAGDVVWDVGANVGLFTFAAAGLAGTAGAVYAIEPDASLVELLRRSSGIRNAKAARIEVLPCAVADSVSLRNFNIASRARAANYLDGHGSTQTGGVREAQVVICVSLDWLATQLPAPSLIKIDAEGAEARILIGGERVLKQYRPKIICEVSSENQSEVTTILSHLGYLMFDAEQPKPNRRPVTRAPWSTLAIPATAG